MGVLKRVAFFWGLILGLATVAVAGMIALTYLFTGKLPSVEMTEEGPAGVLLMTPEEVVTMVREQVDKAKEAQAEEVPGGEYDVQ